MISRTAPQLVAILALPWLASAETAAPKGAVSYFHEVRPIFQANCQGCHQPAKSKGGYVMTDFKKLIAGGDKEGAAVVPGNPAKGSLLDQVTPTEGSAEMPKNKPPLPEPQLALIRQWIAEGAKDDTPADAEAHFDAEHPPVYPRLPAVASLDYSNDGQLIAVAGFHEILLQKADGSGLAGRLIGISQRVQSLRFSPDGKWLAAAAGDPGRSGELQVWDVSTGKLKLSQPVGWDTLYGVSWSPDSTQVAFGCADNTVRAVEVATGKLLLQMGSHSDWALETVFSLKGDHVISVGRDMTAKLSELTTQRFIDNITSITPGALRGGLGTVDRHPSEDVVAVGGADGIPQLFRIFRTAARKIGDNANLVRKYEPMIGRVNVVRFARDGSRMLAGSALDGAGELAIYAVGKDFTGSARIQTLRAKPEKSRTPAEETELQGFEKQVGERVAKVQLKTAIYTAAFQPDGQAVAAAGSDGVIRIFDANTGAQLREFPSVPVDPNAKPRSGVVIARTTAELPLMEGEVVPAPEQVLGIEVTPNRVELAQRNDYVQLLVTARLSTGETADVTRVSKLELGIPVATLTARGRVLPSKDGTTQLKVSFAGKTLMVPVSIGGTNKPYAADFIRDVNPVMTKLGCNQGTCHGAKDGKGGFKLSLRGYDPGYDIRALTDDLAARRVSLSSPDDSLMLRKAIAEVPHEGGRRCEVADKTYQIMRQWIAEGARVNLSAPRVVKIEISPINPVVGQVGSRQQMRIVAGYTDGSSRDVTAESFVESGNTDVASVDPTGLVNTLRRGEAPVLARFEGNYAATTVTVMGERKGFQWKAPLTWNRPDELVAAKWERMKIEPSELCSDNEFLRRVYFDLTGLPPTTDRLRSFLADPREPRVKREAVIDELIGSAAFIDHWTNKWSDLLQVNPKFLGKEGAEGFRGWIRTQIEKNTPYDQFVREILTAQGSNFTNPAASYWKILRQPADAMENTTHLFLATRFNCNKCHDHPFERWTQDQYYQTTAYFSQFSLTDDAANSKGRKLGGTAVEGAKALFEAVQENPAGEVKHDRTGSVAEPKFPYPAKAEVDAKAPRRVQLAAWMTSPDNRYFASSYVNRLWGYLLGRGIIEPLDDIRAGNPPTNPELLDHLSTEFIKSGFNVRQILRLICSSRTYQLSIRTNRWNEDDSTNYSHAVARRLPAEILYDAVFQITGSPSGTVGGFGVGGMVENSGEVGGFLANLGKPARESSCECERSNDLRLGSVMALLSGPIVSGAIQNPKSDLAKLTSQEKDDGKLINELFLRVLSREANPKEVEATTHLLGQLDVDHQQIASALAAKEKEQAPIIAQREKERVVAIAKSEKALADYEQVTKFYREEREAARKEREKRASVALKGWDAQIDQAIAGWMALSKPAEETLTWNLLNPKEVQATGNQVVLKAEADGTVVSSGASQRSDYTVTIETDLKGITGLLLEVLPDPASPQFGPGRAKDGNFVLSEFGLTVTSKAKPAENKVAAFSGTWASFEQEKFPIAAAIDGSEDGNNGWAIAGSTGRRQLAAFKLDQAIVGGEGTRLKLRLAQKNQDGQLIARFRIYATTQENPLGEGIPMAIAAAVKTEPSALSADAKKLLAEYVRAKTPEYWRLRMEEVNAKQPLIPDPALTEAQTAVARAKEPQKLDPILVQLRGDAAASQLQINNKRLTVVQDLTWALINNPAFLFNR